MSADRCRRDHRRHAPRGRSTTWSTAPSRRTPMPSNGTSPGCTTECRRVLGLDLPIADWAKEEGIADERDPRAHHRGGRRQDGAEGRDYGADIMRMAERSLLLQLLDQIWKEHLLALDHLRQGINLRAYGQRDPLNEYKREAFELFQEMLDSLREQVTSVLCHVELRVQRPEAGAGAAAAACSMVESREDPAPEPAATRRWRAPTAARRRAVGRRALGAHAAQRALPVRLGQEIQALPRPRLSRPPAAAAASASWCGRWNRGESYRYLIRRKEPRKARLLNATCREPCDAGARCACSRYGILPCQEVSRCLPRSARPVRSAFPGAAASRRSPQASVSASRWRRSLWPQTRRAGRAGIVQLPSSRRW